MRIAAIAIVFAACAAPLVQPSPSAHPSSPLPTQMASASPTPAGTPAPTATAARRVPAAVQRPAPSDLVVRLERTFHTCCPSAAFVLMADGRVITRDDGGRLVERRLAPTGVQQVRDELRTSGLFDRDQTIALETAPGAPPLPQRGVDGYIFRVWNVDRTVRVFSPTIDPGEEIYFRPSPPRTRATDLADKLLKLERWLPAGVWSAPTPQPYRPNAYRFVTVLVPIGGPAPRVADVDWPFSTSLDAFGDQLDLNQTAIHIPAGPGAARCTGLSTSDFDLALASITKAGARVDTLLDATTTLLAAPTPGMGFFLWIQWLLPDEAAC